MVIDLENGAASVDQLLRGEGPRDRADGLGFNVVTGDYLAAGRGLKTANSPSVAEVTIAANFATCSKASRWSLATGGPVASDYLDPEMTVMAIRLVALFVLLPACLLRRDAAAASSPQPRPSPTSSSPKSR
jgi:hypothetical protein